MHIFSQHAWDETLLRRIHIYPGGRLGNLLFYAAAGSYFHNLFGRDKYIPKWHGSLQDLFLIEKLLPIDFQYCKKCSVTRWLFSKLNPDTKLEGFLLRAFHKTQRLLRIFNASELLPKHIHHWNFESRKNVIFDFFQTFTIVESQINVWRNYALREYSMKLSAHLLSLLQSDDLFVVHLRFGDYLESSNRKVYGELSGEFYWKALKCLGAKKESRVLVATDDRDAAYKKLRGVGISNLISMRDLQFSSPEDEFMALTLSRNKVISNSTFSWWAGYLSPESSRVVAPSPLSKDGSRPDAWDDRWISVDSSWSP